MALKETPRTGCGGDDPAPNLASDVRLASRGAGQLLRPKGRATLPCAERRQLTVLFCDLVGSTALSQRLDPEDLSEVVRVYQERCTTAIVRFGGHVASYMGDGALAYFGYPHAREDAAERAVRAGLAIVDAIDTLKPGPDLTLQVRIGIATGLVVSEPIDEAAQGTGAVGQPLNLAARLQALAEPGTVVIAESTRRLVGGLFALEDLGCHALEGVTAPVQAWRVSGEGVAENRFAALRGASLMPLVGRRQELTLLLDRWARARKGEGQVVLLAGEPGIGKSRLVQALRDRLAGEPHVHQGYSCSSHRQDSPLQPVIAQLERTAGFVRGDDPGQKLAKLEALLAREGEDIARAIPLIASLLSIPSDGRYPPLDMRPSQQREQTLAALVDQLAGLAARRPVLLVWEDVHWADPTSLELLGLAIARLQSLPVLALVTFRPEFTPPWPHHTRITRLTLHRLSRQRCGRLIAGLTGGKSLPAVVVDQIVAKAEGVPLFVEELTKAVLESGLLREENDGYRLVGPLPPLAIPATLQDSLMARLDRLAPVKDVAQVAAAIGREFSHELLAAVVPLPSDELDRALAELAGAELIFQQGLPPQATYAFKHALVQAAAYESALKSRRRQLHGTIARILEERFARTVETEPEVLAHHCAAAGLVEEAIGYWGKAGRQAIARSAMAEAAGHLRRALELMPALPDTPARWRRELELQTALGTALTAVKGYTVPETRRVYDRARALCEQLGDTPRLVTIANGQCIHHLMRAEMEAALEVADDLLRRAEQEDNLEARLAAHRLVGIAVLYAGRLREAGQHLEAAAAILEEAGETAVARMIAGKAALVVVPTYRAILLLLLGRYDQARTQIELALARARRLKRLPLLASTLAVASWLHVLRDEDAPHDLVDTLDALAAEQGFPYWAAEVPLHRGLALARAGRTREGIALVREGVARYDALGAAWHAPVALCLAAGLVRGAERLALVDEAAARFARTGVRFFDAEVRRVRGMVLAEAGDGVGAEAQFTAALGIARGQGARHWELRAAVSLAGLWRAQGRSMETYALLAPIDGWFTEGFATKALVEARRLLHGLGEQPSSRLLSRQTDWP